MRQKSQLVNTQVAISPKMGTNKPVSVNELTKKTLYTGLFGTLYPSYVKNLGQSILDKTKKKGYNLIVVDLSNVDKIAPDAKDDFKVLYNLLISEGLNIILCSVPASLEDFVAETSPRQAGIVVVKKLKSAIKEAFSRQGLQVVEQS